MNQGKIIPRTQYDHSKITTDKKQIKNRIKNSGSVPDGMLGPSRVFIEISLHSYQNELLYPSDKPLGKIAVRAAYTLSRLEHLGMRERLRKHARRHIRHTRQTEHAKSRMACRYDLGHG